MAGFLGTIAGRIRIDVKQAVASYAAVRAANAQTLYALRGSSTAFIGAGKGMIVAGGLMAAAFGVAVNAAAEFERKMDFFGAVTNATGEQMEKVSEKALQLGKDTIYSADQIASSFVELGKAGISAELIMSGVGEAVANLGASADIPLTDAADIITAAVQTFALKGEDAVHVADLLQGAANASIVEVQDLGVSLKYVGGIAASVSIPIESTIDALSLLGKAGIKGSTAGTSLRQIMVSLTGTSKKASAELEKLGIITKNGTNLFYTKAGAIKPLAQVFQILQDKTKGLSEAERLAAFKIIFNNRALAAANILTREGAKGFQIMNEEISKTTAADVSAKRLDNLSGDIEILKGNIETFLIQAGGPFQQVMRFIVQGLTKLVQAFANLPQGVQVAIFAFLGIGGALLIIMGSISLVIGTVTNFIGAIKGLGFAMTFIRGAITAVTGAVRLLGLAFVANPIGLIITAVGLLITGFILLYQHSETFRNIIANIGKFFMRVWEGVLAFFSDVPGFFRDLWGNIQKAFSAGIDWIKENWQKLIVIFGGPLVWIVALVVKFKDQIIDFFKNLGSKAVELMGNLVEGVVDWFRQLPERILRVLGFLLGLYVRYWQFLLTTALNIVRSIVEGVVNFFRTLPERLVAIFQWLVETGVRFFQNLHNALVNITKSIIDGVINFFKTLPEKIAYFIGFMVGSAIRLWNEFRAKSIELARTLVQNVIQFIQSLPQRIPALFNAMRTKAVQILQNMLTAARNLATRIKDGFINIIQNLPGLVAQVFQNVLNNITGFIGNLGSAARDAGTALWEGFKDGLGIASPSYLEKAVFQINKTFDKEVPKMKRSAEKINSLGNDVSKNGPAAKMCDTAKVAADCIAREKKKYSGAAANSPAANSGRAASQAQTQARGNSEGWSEPVRTSAAVAAVADYYENMARRAANERFRAPHGAPPLEINIHNPAPEPASESVTRVAARLTHLGLLEA